MTERSTEVSSDVFDHLPRSIWIAGSSPVAVYHGNPVEIVRSMAREMDPSDLSVTDAVQAILIGLARRWGIVLAFPEEVSDETLCGLFVYALLDTGIGRPLPLA